MEEDVASPRASAETNFTDAVAEVLGAADDFDFHAHEVKRQVAPVDFRKAHGVLLCGDDDFRLALFAAIDGVENFLLGEAMMIGEAFGIDEFRSEFDEALLETLVLRDAAERGDLAAFEQIQIRTLAGENVLKIKRAVNAFDDAGGRVMLGDALAQILRAAVAFGDEDDAGAGEVRRRFAQGTARLQMLVAKRLLTVNQHHVLAAAREFPVLKTVVEQQRVAAEFFDGVASAFHAVLVHEHDHVLQI